jgi:alpha-aminoadipic semialdehyde synthase
MGSIEFLMKTTSIDQPLFIYEPRTGEVFDAHSDKDYIYKPGILFCAVDNFPTEFPKEATNWFGDHLLPFLEAVVKSDMAAPMQQQLDLLPPEISRAVITVNGELTPKFKYIFDLRKENEKK